MWGGRAGAAAKKSLAKKYQKYYRLSLHSLPIYRSIMSSSCSSEDDSSVESDTDVGSSKADTSDVITKLYKDLEIDDPHAKAQMEK